jgi:hypothetical protein
MGNIYSNKAKRKISVTTENPLGANGAASVEWLTLSVKEKKNGL